MTSVRKRKMARSSVRKNTKRVKDAQKKVKVTGHPLMAKYWDPKLTFQQNYEKLGLTVSLAKDKGGREKKLETVTERRAREGEDSVEDSEDEENDGNRNAPSLKTVALETDPLKIPLGEARIIRDPETNEVVKIIHGQMDPNAVKQVEEKPKFSIIDKLIEYNDEHATPVHVTVPSDREAHWLQQLYEKHGDDYEKMKWDTKLNLRFMSAGHLESLPGFASNRMIICALRIYPSSKDIENNIKVVLCEKLLPLSMSPSRGRSKY